MKGLFGNKKQDFLEADPYWDQSTVPVNTYKNKAPFSSKVISCKRIVGPKVRRQRICLPPARLAVVCAANGNEHAGCQSALIGGNAPAARAPADRPTAEPPNAVADPPLDKCMLTCALCRAIVRRGRQATGETCHIIMGHKGKMPYWEGQSYGVIPPGTNPKNGKPNSVRLYSIASSRYGDDMTGTTTSLCVRRATYWCPELKADDPAKKGICSNFLCDAKPGEELKLTGPSGKVMLIPEKDPNVDLIMVSVPACSRNSRASTAHRGGPPCGHGLSSLIMRFTALRFGRLRLALVSRHTAPSSAVSLSRRRPSARRTRASRGSSSASPTLTPCSTTTSGRRSSSLTRKTSVSTTRSRVSRPTSTAARCTSRTRSRSTRTRSLTAWTRVYVLRPA